MLGVIACGFLLISGLWCFRGRHSVSSKRLELDSVRICFHGYVDEFLCELHAPIMIDACLGDNETGLAIPDRFVAHFYRLHRATAHSVAPNGASRKDRVVARIDTCGQSQFYVI
jgi:hypothetical protein